MAQTSGITAKGVPPQPAWLFYLKIAILVLSVIILGLAAWAVSIFGAGGVYWYGSGYGGFMIFVTIFTFIVYGGALGLELGAPHLFYRVVGLIVYGLSLIFWLSAWAYCASGASLYLAIGTGWGSITYDNYAKKEGSALAACAGLGAVVWILAIVHFAFFIKACLADPSGNGASQAELGAVKTEPAGQSYPAQQYPAGQTYPAQPQYPVQPQQPYATQQTYASQ